MTPLEGRDFKRMGEFLCASCAHTVFWNKTWASYQCHKNENQCECFCGPPYFETEQIGESEMGV